MKLLVPIDGSGFSLNAVEHAAKMANAFGDTEVDLVYVIVYEPNFMDSGRVLQELGSETAKKVMTEATALFKKKSNAPLKEIVKTGNSAASIITDIAENKKYDGIVMGSKGKSNLQRFLVGSVSNRVVHHAPCTVTLVR